MSLVHACDCHVTKRVNFDPTVSLKVRLKGYKQKRLCRYCTHTHMYTVMRGRLLC